MASVLGVGYSYGLIRANLPQNGSHFIFDAACLGFYLSAWVLPLNEVQYRKVRKIWPWVVALALWPTLLLFVPAQDFLIQLVGLRSALFFLPAVLIGAVLEDEELYLLAVWLAIFNLGAFAFGVAEYIWGVSRFLPHNASTSVIYAARDVTRGNFFRIPATFVNPAGYGATMIMSLPILLSAWLQAQREPWKRWLLLSAMFAAILGVFLCASRTQAAFLMALGIVVTLTGRLPVKSWILWTLVIVGIGYIVATSDRLQRFTQLEDASMVEQRIGVAVNQPFVDLVSEVPGWKRARRRRYQHPVLPGRAREESHVD